MKTKLIVAVTLIMSLFCSAQEEMFVTSNNALYRKTNYNCGLAYIGLTNIGTTAIYLNDIALMPNGSLWGTYSNKICTVNKLTGTVTIYYTLPVLDSSPALLALDNNYLLLTDGTNLAKFNVNTNTLEYLGNIGFTASGDLFFFDGKLYMTSANRLIKINMNADFTAITSTEVVIYDASFPNILGAFTVSNPQYSANYVLGFSTLTSVVKICPISGTWQHICQPSVPGYYFYGATATELPIQNPPTNPCPTLMVEDIAVLDDEAITISPNPASQQSPIQIIFSNYLSTNTIEVTIFSLDGKAIYKQTENPLTNSNNTVEIDLQRSSLSTGIYMVELGTDGKRKSLKLVVN